MDKEKISVFGTHFFEIINAADKFISQIKTDARSDYYNTNHIEGPIDALNEETLVMIKDLVKLRKKFSYLAIKRTNFLVKHLFELYDNDRGKGKEAIFFLLQLLKDEWEEMEIKRLIQAVIENAESQSQKMRIVEDISDLKLFKRLIRR